MLPRSPPPLCAAHRIPCVVEILSLRVPVQNPKWLFSTSSSNISANLCQFHSSGSRQQDGMRSVGLFKGNDSEGPGNPGQMRVRGAGDPTQAWLSARRRQERAMGSKYWRLRYLWKVKISGESGDDCSLEEFSIEQEEPSSASSHPDVIQEHL